MYINTIIDEETENKIGSPYLDNPYDDSRGDEGSNNEFKSKLDSNFVREWLEKSKVYTEIEKANACGKSYAKFTDVKTGTKKAYKQIQCYKFWCPTCGGRTGLLHNKKYNSVLRRINVNKFFARQLVFTIPDDLRDRFMSKEMINKFLSLTQRLIEREFGVYVSDKTKHGKVKEKQYQLNKFTVAYLHLDGDELKFNPHVNVHIFEQEGSYKLSAEKLFHIRKSYKKALTHLLGVPITEVNCHYSYKVGSAEVKNAINYMTKPTDARMAAVENNNLVKFLCLDLKNLRYVRFWGKASNSRYKENTNTRKKNNLLPKINGEAYKFVGILSQCEFEAEIAGRKLSTSSQGFIITIDDFN